MLWKFTGDKGAGLFKLILNTITRENLAAAMVYAGNPCKQDIEDILHRRCVLFHERFGGQVEVGLVKKPASATIVTGQSSCPRDMKSGATIRATMSQQRSYKE